MATINITRQSNGAVTIGGKEVANPQNVICKCTTQPDGTIRVLIRMGRNVLYMANSTGIGLINGTAAPTNAADLQDTLANGVFAGSSTYATPAKYNQTITFVAPASVPHTNPPITLTGTSSSGLPLTYVSGNNAVFTISGNVLTPVGAGTTTITASQAGNSFYNSATPVVVSLTLS